MARPLQLITTLALIAGLSIAVAVADERVLHEFVPDVDPNEAVLGLERADGSPAAITYDGEVLPAPELGSTEHAASPPMMAETGDSAMGEEPGRRSPSFHPDRETELEGTLDYYAAFNPAIAPFKRVTSLDRVIVAADGVTPVLVVADRRLRRVPVADGPDAGPARDRFWGEARLDFSGGARVPLPSVAPDSRILSLRTEPTVALTVERDGADNFFARLPGDEPHTRIEVAFLTDAPRSYFGTGVPTVSLTDLESRPPAMPATVRARALLFASELGLSPQVDLRRALHVLTAHFRAFEESADPPADSGDIYLDLVRAQKGVCRHRAYGFVVTAQALGILARFVQNEAHSWVEVALPGNGFMRIDLGGAAHGLRAHNADDRPVYHPAEPDQLPRPPAYEESYSQLGRNASGFRQPDAEALEGRWVSPSEAEQAATAPESFSSDTAVGDAEPSAEAEQPSGGRLPLAIAVDQRRERVLRGRQLAISGRVQAAGRGVAGQRVEISLAAPDRRERMLLGVTVTTEGGYFRASLGIPPDLAVGDYRLVVIAPGDEHHGPAIAP